MNNQYDRTLLESTGIPTLDQMQENIQEHDYTTEMHLMDPELDKDLHLPAISEQQKEIEKYFLSLWEDAYKKIYKYGRFGNYSCRHPIIVLGTTYAKVIAQAVITILHNKNLANAIISAFYKDMDEHIQNEVERCSCNPSLKQDHTNIASCIDRVATAVLQKMVYLLMLALKVPAIVNLLKTKSDFSDFDEHNKYKLNTERTNFYRGYYHSQTQYGIPLSLNDIEVPSNCNQTEEQVAISLFLDTLSQADRQILELHMQKYTQTEIAEMLGYRTASAVSKRLTAIKRKIHNELSR